MWLLMISRLSVVVRSVGHLRTSSLRRLILSTKAKRSAPSSMVTKRHSQRSLASTSSKAAADVHSPTGVSISIQCLMEAQHLMPVLQPPEDDMTPMLYSRYAAFVYQRFNVVEWNTHCDLSVDKHIINMLLLFLFSHAIPANSRTYSRSSWRTFSTTSCTPLTQTTSSRIWYTTTTITN